MKLSTPQLEKIEHYLLDWNLEYQDFYDEVLDHFVTATGKLVSKGEDFETAFNTVKKDFSGKRFKSFRGLKAFEMEYASVISKEFRKELRGRILLQFKSLRILVWIGLGLAGYGFLQRGNEMFFNLLAGLCAVTLVLIFCLIDRENFKSRLWGDFITSHWPLEKRKRKLLFKKSRQRLALQCISGGLGLLGFALNGANIIRSVASWQSSPGWLGGLQVALLIMFISMMWAFLELQIKERKRTV